MRQKNATERIKRAVAYIMETQGELPRRVKDRIKLIQQTTKKLFNIVVHEKTLRRQENMQWWHPKHRMTERGQEKEIDAGGGAGAETQKKRRPSY